MRAGAVRAGTDERRRSRATSTGGWPTCAKLEDELQLGDLEAAADYLVVNDDVSEVAVLGFCMGGMYAFKAAADRSVRSGRLVLRDGAVPGGMARPAPGRTARDRSARCVPTLAIFGGADPYTPAADIEALRAAWGGRDRL